MMAEKTSSWKANTTHESRATPILIKINNDLKIGQNKISIQLLKDVHEQDVKLLGIL